MVSSGYDLLELEFTFPTDPIYFNWNDDWNPNCEKLYENHEYCIAFWYHQLSNSMVDIDSIWRIINPQICEKKYNGASKTKLKGQRETINHH